MATAWSGFSPEDQAKIKLEFDNNRPTSKTLILLKMTIIYSLLLLLNCSKWTKWQLPQGSRHEREQGNDIQAEKKHI